MLDNKWYLENIRFEDEVDDLGYLCETMERLGVVKRMSLLWDKCEMSHVDGDDEELTEVISADVMIDDGCGLKVFEVYLDHIDHE